MIFQNKIPSLKKVNEKDENKSESMILPDSISLKKQISNTSYFSGKSAALAKFQKKVSILRNIMPMCARQEIDLKIDRSMISIHNKKTRDIIMAILMLPLKLKTEEHIKFLRRALKAEPAFFEIKKRVPKRVFNKLFEELRHEYITTHKEIYRSSETLKKFYVLLEGEVYNLIERSRLVNSGKQSVGTRDEYLNSHYSEMETLSVLKPGESFGGFSIISEDRQITTTVTKSNVHLAIIPIEIYRSLLENHAKEILNEKIDFLGNSIFLKQLGRYSLQLLLFYSEEMKLEKGKYLFRQGDISKNVYLIISGEIQLSSNIEIIDKNEENDSRPKNTQSSRNVFLNKIHNAKLKKKSTMNVKLRLFNRGDFLGDWEIFDKIPLRKYEAQIVSRKCQLFCFRANKFFDFVKEEDSKELLKFRKEILEQEVEKYKNLYSIPNEEKVDNSASIDTIYKSTGRINSVCCRKGFASKPKDLIRSASPKSPLVLRPSKPVKIPKSLKNPTLKIFQPNETYLIKKLERVKIMAEESENKKTERSRSSANYYFSKPVASTAITTEHCKSNIDESMSLLMKRMLVNMPVHEETGLPRNYCIRPNTAMSKGKLEIVNHSTEGLSTFRPFSGKKLRRPKTAIGNKRICSAEKKEKVLSTYYFTFENLHN